MGWFKERAGTIHAALGVRRYLLAPFVGAVVGFVDWLASKLEEFGLGSLIGVPSWAIGVLAALLMVAYFFVEYAVTLRRQLAPQLKLGDLEIVREGTREVLRVSVVNKGVGVFEKARASLVKLTPLPDRAAETNFPAILQTEGQRHRGEKTSRFHVDGIPKNVVVALNAVDATQRTPISIPSERHDFKLSREKRYRLSLVVGCEEGRALQKSFTLFVKENNELGIENHGGWEILEP